MCNYNSNNNVNNNDIFNNNNNNNSRDFIKRGCILDHCQSELKTSRNTTEQL